MKLSFITDEVTQSLEAAITFAVQNGLDGVELRTVEDTAIDRVPPVLLQQWRRQLNAAGLLVCALSGSFYKCTPEPAQIEAELEKLVRLCKAADILGCQFIRGFSFFTEETGRASAEVLAPYFARAVAIMEKYDKILLLEADPSVNTCNHALLAQLLQAIDSQRVRAIFDPGNSLYDPLGERPYPDAYQAICPYFAHVHIKDAVRCAEESYCVKVGTGEVGYAKLIHALVESGYNGWLSMETHYRLNATLSEEQMRLPGGAAFSQGGAAATAESIVCLKALLAKEGAL